MVFVWSLFGFSVTAMVAFLVLYVRKQSKSSRGKLKQKKLCFKICPKCFQNKQQTKCFFCKANQNQTLLPSCNQFFLGAMPLVQVGNKVVCISKKQCSTTRLQTILFHCKQTKLQNGSHLFGFTLANLENCEQIITMWLKTNFCVATPTLNTKQKHGLVVHHYEGNSLGVVCYNQTKKHIQVQVEQGMRYAIHKVTIVLQPKQRLPLKWLLTLQQSAMQTPKNIAYEPMLQTNLVTQNNWKVQVFTKNKQLNELVNVVLPNKIEAHCIKQNCNAYHHVFTTNVKNLQGFSYHKVVKWLLVRKEYARCYHFLLVNVLGVQPMGNLVRFFKNHQLLGNFTVAYQNNTITKYNFPNSFYFLFGNIIYKNVFVLHLKPFAEVAQKGLT